MSGPRRHAELRAAVEAAARDAARGPAWVAALREIEPPDALAAFADFGGGERFFFERPADGFALASRGAAAVVEGEGAGRFTTAASGAAQLFERLHLADGGLDEAPPLVGGFAFADAAAGDAWRGYPGGRLVLPELAILQRAGRACCVVARPVSAHDDPTAVAAALEAELDASRALGAEPLLAACDDEDERAPEFRAVAERPLADYRARVAAALDAIAGGELEKVVVARAVRLARRGGLDPVGLLSALRRSHPTCTSFAVARDDALFLGASPERLVRLVGRRVETAAVAGSAPRGKNPAEDARLARELRESKKEQAEHEVVVRALRDGLLPHCEELSIPEAPRMLALEGIQHLETPIHATLREGRSVLDLVGALHPTPAVAGAPRDAALRWLADGEQLDRGWYAGPIGFVTPDGGGEFVVALRSALLRGDEARLFAGAGIVDGSRPAAELRETRLKLRALLSPLLEI